MRQSYLETNKCFKRGIANFFDLFLRKRSTSYGISFGYTLELVILVGGISLKLTFKKLIIISGIIDS